MKKTISGLLALVFGCGVALGGEVVSEKQVKELEKMIEDAGIYVETAKKGVVLSGYVDASYSYNANGGGTDYGWNGTPGGIRTHMFDVDSNDFNVNQIKLALEKALPEENTWAAGFRVDLMFGEDAKYLSQFGAENDAGMGSDEFFVEQAYVQFRVPVGNGLDFKFGKFVSLLGYEVIETPANLNVSRGYWFTFGVPWTHTGFLMSYKFNDMIDAKLGLVNGWNNSDSNFLDEWANGENGDDGPADFAKAITAQIAIHAPGGNADLVNSFIYSFEGEILPSHDWNGDEIAAGWHGMTDDSEDHENAGIFVWDIWGQWRPLAFNDKLLLAFNAGIGKTFDNHQGDKWVNGDWIGVDENTDTWWGASVYAKYQLTDVVSIALRGEYFHDDDGTARVQDLDNDYFDNENWSDNRHDPYFVNSTDLWSFTATVGFDLWENMLCRLEYRLDIASSDGGNALEDFEDDDDDFNGDEDGVEQNVFTNNQSTQHTFLLNLSYSF